MKCEIEELEGKEKEWDSFYQAKRSEMEEFKELHRKFESDTREEVQRMRETVSSVCDPISLLNIANKISSCAFSGTFLQNAKLAIFSLDVVYLSIISRSCQ